MIKEISKSMEYSESLEEYKKLQKKLKKTQKTYLKQLKQYASLSKEYLLTKRDIAEAYYNSHALPQDNKIRPLSDSLNNVGVYDVSQSLALFDVIIKFNGKTPEESLADKLYKATDLLKTGLSHINAANDLSFTNDDNNPMVLTYYGITDPQITNNNIISENINNDSNSYYNDVITNNNTTNENATNNNTTNENVTNNNRTNENVTNNNRTNENVTNNNRTNENVTDNNRTNENVTNNNRTNENVTNNNRTNNNTNRNNVNNNTNNTNRYSTTETIIDASRGSFYSDRNPIPTLEITDELCYRIQIGAFRQNVENDAFIGLMPIFKESIPGSNLLRYVAGLFFTFNSAQAALQKVKAIGYTDAFIIAYYKGRRIHVYEARNVENGGTLPELPEYIADNNNNNNNNNINNRNVNNNINNNANNVANNNENTNVTVNRNNANIVVESDLQKSTGVFYCVQIGVYREKLGPERLYNLSPLMYDAYGNGLIRHACGKYYDFNLAIEEQNRIRQLGIKDAFVIAYVDGKRVNNYEAAAIITKMETVPKDQIIVTTTGDANQPYIADNNNNNVADNNNNNNNVADNNIDNNDNNTENIAADQKPKVEYYIQLGVFKNDISDFIKNSFKRLAGNNKLYKLTGNNIIVYRIGAFTTYNSAVSGLNNVRAGGVKDAFIVALVNGKRVDVATAKASEQ